MRKFTRIFAYVGIAILVLGQFSCAPATVTMPARYLTLEASTPSLTPVPADTATQAAAPTSTDLPTLAPSTAPATLVTSTFTPNVTATQLPDLGTPASGTGNVTGLVLWNDQPVPQAAVWLCETFQGTCKGPEQYRVNADERGYYAIKKVTPGKYIVAINSFNTGWFIFYVDKNGAREQTVSADQNLILDPFNIWKFNLRSLTPKPNKILAEAKPVFTWEAYPDAAYYQISIYDAHSKPVVEGQRLDGLSFTPTDSLVTCKYSWEVDAFNKQGIRIASTSPRNTNFSVINVPGTC